jgi:hypothetical protein
MIPGAQSVGASSLAGEDEDVGLLAATITLPLIFLAALERTAAAGTVGVDESTEIEARIAFWNDPVAEYSTDVVASTES